MSHPPGLDGPLSRTVTTAAKYVADSRGDNTTLFEDALVTLTRVLHSVDPTARLSLSSQLVVDFLGYCPIILSGATTSASTRSKLHRLLFNIAFFNVRLRRYMAGDLELCGHVFHCLKLSLKEQLGPQNMIDILRLQQVLTYEKCLVLGLWTNELISFLMAEVNRDTEMEWMPFCIAILCNLASRSKTVCNRMKKSSSYKLFCRRILGLLSHDSRIVVVSALVLVGYVDDKFRDVVYCPQNIRETFQCVFNVIAGGDQECVMTRHIAVDLLKRLVVSDAPAISSVPVITTTGKDVMNYVFFASSVQNTARLIVTLDFRIEETMKVYDLLLSFCSLPQLRSHVCSAILSIPSTVECRTTPVLAIMDTAAASAEAAIDISIPIKAMRLLTHLCREIVDSNQRVSSLLSPAPLMTIVGARLKTSIDTASEDSIQQCQLVVEGLRLADVCSQEDDLRALLLELASAPLCAHIAEFQLMTNPIVLQMAKPPVQRTDKIPDWSVHGVSIVLDLIRLLASLKDHSKPHKLQYWNSLKDERLLPFLAYAVAYGDHEMVHDALVLYTHCAQVQAFPSRLLADLVASCAIAKRLALEQATCISLNASREGRRMSPDQMDFSDQLGSELNSSLNRETNRAVDDLLHKIRTGLQITDLKMSDVLTAYEKKIGLLEARERELERVIASSERLRLHSRNAANGGSEAEMSRIRSLVADCEGLRESNDKLVMELETNRNTAENKFSAMEKALAQARAEKDRMAAELHQERHLVSKLRSDHDEQVVNMQAELSRLRDERDDLTAEIVQEREVVVQARQHSEDQKKRLEVASAALLEKSNQLSVVNNSLKEYQDDLLTLNRKYDQDCASWRMQNEALSAELESMKNQGQKTQADLERMRRLREEMLTLAEGFK